MVELLLLAADGGHEAGARALLLYGANVDAAATTGKTGLVHAAFRGHEAVSLVRPWCGLG